MSLLTSIPPFTLCSIVADRLILARMATATITKTMERVQPSQSLYLQNLPEKLPKPDLRRALYMLFSPHGPVLDVVALKTPTMRGQAHVLFRNVQDATQAMRALQNYDFFGREMVRRP